MAMASGALGVAVGACRACGSPLVVSSREGISLPCPHCREPVGGAAGEVLVDQWTEPWARVDGGGLDLEYRLAVIEGKTGLAVGCPTCGTPAPSDDGSDRCPQCGSVTWVRRAGEPGRIQLGVRVDGLRDKRPFKTLLPIALGEAMLRADVARGHSGRSGNSLLGATAIGCAAVLAIVVLVSLGIALAVHFARC
jgi:uncharacterized Zn finger protein (UPF0148 family)